MQRGIRSAGGPLSGATTTADATTGGAALPRFLAKASVAVADIDAAPMITDAANRRRVRGAIAKAFLNSSVQVSKQEMQSLVNCMMGQAHPSRARAGVNSSDQLFFAPSRIQALIASRSQVDSFFLPSGMWVSGAPRQSSSHIKLLPSASPGITILPDLVPFMTPS
jgi:hypothetical protein